jgi:hypothetical protein
LVLGPLPNAVAADATTEATVLELLQAVKAQQKELAEQKRRLEEQAKKLAGQDAKLAAQARQLDEQQRNLKKMNVQLRAAASAPSQAIVQPAAYTDQAQSDGGAPVPVAPGGTPEGAPGPKPPTTESQPTAPGSQSPAQPQAPGATEAAPSQPEKYEKPREQLLLEAGGILLPEGALQIEPSFQFENISSNQVSISGFTIFDAIVIGTIQVNKLYSNLVTGEVTGRLGLPFNTQLDLVVPGIYRRDTTTFGVGTSTAQDETIEGWGLGDIQAGIEWQPIIGHGWIPDTVLRVVGQFPTGKSAFDIDTREIPVQGGGTRRVLEQSPTGSGFYVIEPGFTVLWRFDPIAVFGGGTYKHAFARNFGNFGTIQPGDSFEFFAGMNFAITDQIAINAAFDDQIVTSTTQNGDKVAGSSFNDGRVILGGTVGLTPNISLLGQVEIGLTQQSPDFVASVRLPITFSLF